MRAAPHAFARPAVKCDASGMTLATPDAVEAAPDQARDLLQRLHDARRRTDALFAEVGAARMHERPIAERHRFLFYLGHLEAFDWNLLGEACGAPRKPHPWDRLFAFGIDPTGNDLPTDRPDDWPSLAEVGDYAGDLRALLDRCLPGALARGDGDLRERVGMAVEHRLMHAETLAYLLDRSAIRRPVVPQGRPRAAPATQWVQVPAGRTVLGTAPGGASFTWDNEHDALELAVPAFAMARCMTSNGEYLQFVEAGGYADPAWWSAEGWQWRERDAVTHPAYWQHAEGRWHWRTARALVPLPLDWPVYVSHAEAAAYARWRGAALPSEAQWQRAAWGTPNGRDRAWPWGDAPLSARHANAGFRSRDPEPVDAHDAGDSAFGIRGLVGNGWEWTSSVFAPLPGFRASPAYPGYSADFFDGRHFVLKGGGPQTATCLLRRSFRNWFQPHYPHAHAGIRLVAAA